MPQYPDPTLINTSHMLTGSEVGTPVRMIPAFVNPNGAAHMSTPIRLVGGNHEGTVIDDNRWITSSVGTGNIRYEGHGYAIIDPGTGSNGQAMLCTKHRARFLTPFPNHGMLTIRTTDAGIAGNIREFGVADLSATNGFLFFLSGTQVGVKTIANSTSTIYLAGMPADVLYQTDNRYDIIFYRERAHFYANEELMLSAGAPSGSKSISDTMTLRPFIRSTNAQTIPSGSGTIQVHESSISRWGPFHAQPVWYLEHAGSATKILKKGPGTLHRVIFNDAGGKNGIVTFYDGINASGAVIAEVDTAKIPNPVTLEYGLDFSDGLYVVSQSGSGDHTYVFD